MGVCKKSSESKIIDFIEISSKNEKLHFIYGLLDRNDLFKTHGAKSRIIYPERHDIGNYIFDPLNFYLFAKAQNEYSNSSLLKKLIEIENSCSSWYQKVLDEFTDAIKKEQIDQSNENPQTKVSFICPNIKLDYEDFLLSTKSEILIKYMLQAFKRDEKTFEPIETCSKNLLQKNKRKQKNEEESLKMKKKSKTLQTDTKDIIQLQERIIDFFRTEKLDFFYPNELQQNFKDTTGNKVNLEFKYHAYTYLSQYLDTFGGSALDQDIEAKVLENIDELYFPDRELKTSLHRLFSKRKFSLISKIKDHLESQPLDNQLIENRFKYIYDYHLKFTISKLNAIYSDFDYLFDDSEFDDLDEEWKNLMQYFSNELRKVSNNIAGKFKLNS